MKTLNRTIAILLLVSASARNASAQSKPMIPRPFDPASDIHASLLGEEGSSLRRAKRDVTPCGSPLSPLSNAGKSRFGVEQGYSASIALPFGWTESPVPPLPDGAVAVGTRMVAMLRVATTEVPQYPTQAFVFIGPEEGYPRVVPDKDASIGASVECWTPLASAQRANLIHTEVVLASGVKLTYVLGYAEIGSGVWMSFLSSTPDPLQVPLLRTLFRSAQASAAK